MENLSRRAALKCTAALVAVAPLPAIAASPSKPPLASMSPAALRELRDQLFQESMKSLFRQGEITRILGDAEEIMEKLPRAGS